MSSGRYYMDMNKEMDGIIKDIKSLTRRIKKFNDSFGTPNITVSNCIDVRKILEGSITPYIQRKIKIENMYNTTIPTGKRGRPKKVITRKQMLKLLNFPTICKSKENI